MQTPLKIQNPELRECSKTQLYHTVGCALWMGITLIEWESVAYWILFALNFG